MNTGSRPAVTVYVPCYDYGRYLTQAVDSVLVQSFLDWELIIIDDGSEDQTRAVADTYVTRHPDRVRLIRHERSKGLAACANAALNVARGDYVMRLDADDFLDESALMVLVDFLERHPDICLVYPNFVYVDELGTSLGIEQRRKVGTEVQLLDLPAHGACTMVRKRVLKAVGGYTENYNAQDGHELWLKVLHRYKVGNVSTALFFYRQHGLSVTRDEPKVLAARQRIKRGLTTPSGPVPVRALAVVPARNMRGPIPNVVLEPFAGRPLIDYTLDAAHASGCFDHIFVTTDDPAVVEHCARMPNLTASIRPLDLSLPQTELSRVLWEAVCNLEEKHDVHPDIVVLLSVHCPLRRPAHIREAIDTLLLYNVDSVLSVTECNDVHFVHGERGLEPLNKGMLQRIRLERETLYVENRAICAMWRDAITKTSFFGNTIGHVVMLSEESFRVQSRSHACLVEQVLSRANEGAQQAKDAKTAEQVCSPIGGQST